jgi:hypothetical protein
MIVLGVVMPKMPCRNKDYGETDRLDIMGLPQASSMTRVDSTPQPARAG